MRSSPRRPRAGEQQRIPGRRSRAVGARPLSSPVHHCPFAALLRGVDSYNQFLIIERIQTRALSPRPPHPEQISQRLATKMGGSLTCTSPGIGKGSSFILVLPAVTLSPATSGNHASSGVIGGAAVARRVRTASLNAKLSNVCLRV